MLLKVEKSGECVKERSKEWLVNTDPELTYYSFQSHLIVYLSRAHSVDRHFRQWRKYSEIGYKKKSVGEISDYRVKKGKKKRVKV